MSSRGPNRGPKIPISEYKVDTAICPDAMIAESFLKDYAGRGVLLRLSSGNGTEVAMLIVFRDKNLDKDSVRMKVLGKNIPEVIEVLCHA